MIPDSPVVPLCVDLDQTLVRTNTLAEALVGAVRRDPVCILMIPMWAARGQAYLWARVVERFRPDAALLPYSEPVLALVRAARAEGKPVILATGAHQSVAGDVAEQLGFVSRVFATQGSDHLVGSRKAELLTAEFGARGFDYAGDSNSDLAVFRSCRQAYAVSASAELADRLQQEGISTEWIRSGPGADRWVALWRAARPAQWVKNALVFVPVVLGHRFADGAALWASFCTFAVLCLASSSAYLFNDLIDVEADRRHAAKRSRPVAQGDLSMAFGGAAGIVLMGLALSLGWVVSPRISLLLCLYLASTLAYSLWLKKLLVVDLIMLASFYVFRAYLGAAATGIRISSWTALFCVFIFAGLATVKRYAELRNRGPESPPSANRRAYRAEDAAPLLSIGASCFVGAVIALGLYLGSPEVRVLYKAPDLLWLICPLLLGWTSRLWILGNRGELHDDDPVAFVLRDRWTHAAALLAASIFALAL